MISAAVALLLAAPRPAGAEPSPTARQEIAHLFDYLEQSGCRFNRNGAWHSPTEARSHLDRKYQYLAGKGLADTAEAFIEGAASRSSLSGKAYQVQCAGGPALDSGAWFREELARYRRPGRG
ncbi:MAG: DUF5329 domain-containing protein [Rhodocyclaceae bacterium]|nr:DUF5329 domain-containing protein [Rhodocyclaceae bacterium]